MNNFWTEKQRQDLDFFNKNIQTWLQNPIYRMKFVVISDGTLKGVYDSFESALKYAATTLKAGDYIIQQVLNENEVVNFLAPAVA